MSIKKYIKKTKLAGKTRKNIQNGGKIGFTKRLGIDIKRAAKGSVKLAGSTASLAIASPIIAVKALGAATITGIASGLYRIPLGGIKTLGLSGKALYQEIGIRRLKNRIKKAESLGTEKNQNQIDKLKALLQKKQAKISETYKKTDNALNNVTGMRTVSDIFKSAYQSTRKSTRFMSKHGLLWGMTKKRIQEKTKNIPSTMEILGIREDINRLMSPITNPLSRKLDKLSARYSFLNSKKKLGKSYEDNYSKELITKKQKVINSLEAKSKIYKLTNNEVLELSRLKKEKNRAMKMNQIIVNRLKNKYGNKYDLSQYSLSYINQQLAIYEDQKKILERKVLSKEGFFSGDKELKAYDNLKEQINELKVIKILKEYDNDTITLPQTTPQPILTSVERHGRPIISVKP